MPRNFGLSPEDEARLRLKSFEELAAEGLVLKLWSEVLGETILLVPDAYTPAAGDPVTYTHAEAVALVAVDVDQLKAIHKLKKTLGVRAVEEKKEDAQ